MKTAGLTNQFSYNQKATNLLFIIVAGVLVAGYLMVQPELMSVEGAQSLTSNYDSKIVAYLISFLIMLLCALTPMPAEFIALSNTLVFSPWEAFLVTWLSAIVSANVGYELGRLHYFDPCKIENSKICRWLTRYGCKGLILMRLIPIVPFFALNICAGLFKLGRIKYLLITAITIIPAVAILTFFPHLFL